MVVDDQYADHSIAPPRLAQAAIMQASYY